jgi:TRAP-type C4-dicarboxylate transport system substrate-binding protein
MVVISGIYSHNTKIIEEVIMKRTYHLGFLILFFLCMACLLSAPLKGTSFAKEYRLKLQSSFPHGDKSMDTLPVFASSAEKLSNGQVKIKVFAAPEIVPDVQVLQAAKKGTLDMMQGAGVIWGETIPVAYVEFGLPGAYVVEGVDDFHRQAEEVRNLFFKRGLADILKEEYAKQNLHFLDIHVYGPVPVTVSKVKPEKCSDLEGLIVRSDGLNMIYQTAPGMKAIQVFAEEAYVSLKTGVLDAAEWDISCITGMKWHEVAPYWLRGMEADQAVGNISVNMDVWNEFPDDVKKAVEEAAEKYFYATVDAYKGELDTVYQWAKEGKLEIVKLDKECRDKYVAMAKKIMDEETGDDPATRKAIDIIKEWRGWK